MKAEIAELKRLEKVADWHAAAALIEANSGWAHEAPATVSGIAWKTYTGLGDKARAERWLDQALAAMPDNATWWRCKGDCHRDRKEWRAAAACYARSVELRPDVASFHASHGYALDALGALCRSAEALARVVELNGSIRPWAIRLEQVLSRLGRLCDAADAYAIAMKSGEEDYALKAIHDELCRQVARGACEAEEEYYDDIYSQSEKYAQCADLSIYRPAWERIAALLREYSVTHILDLGCGPGQFAEFLENRLPFVTYVGIDFSAVAVSLASTRCPRYLFERRRLPLRDYAGLPAFDAVICTEVLEYVEQDLQILQSVPAGVAFFGTVPNFYSFSHMRIFENAEQVRIRYDQFFGELSVEGIPLSCDSTLWLMHGKRGPNASLSAAETRT